jgi:hypothetical protein
VSQKVIVTAIENIVKVNVSDVGLQGPRGTQVLSGPSNPSIVIGLIGDQYLNTSTGYLFGPKTEQGWGNGVVIVRGLQIEDVSYTHQQITPLSIWTITHGLQFSPNISVVDTAGNVIEGDYKYNGNTIVATFSQQVAGTAFLS